MITIVLLRSLTIYENIIRFVFYRYRFNYCTSRLPLFFHKFAVDEISLTIRYTFHLRNAMLVSLSQTTTRHIVCYVLAHHLR